jgi:transcriptional regulator with XRE-family HTH domain
MAKRKPLEQWQQEDAARLKALFNKKAGMSQAEFAVRSGIGETQGAVEQYLNARIPLNLEAAIKFARGLGVDVQDFSPRLGVLLSMLPARRKQRADTNSNQHTIIKRGVLIERYENPGSMGPGAEVEQEDRVVEHLVLSEDRLVAIAGRRRSYSSLKVIPAIGNSMSPTLEDGDFVLVDTKKTAIDVDGIFVLRTPQRLFIKRVTFTGEKYEITSDNKAAPPWRSQTNVEVVGRVIWAWNGKKL